MALPLSETQKAQLGASTRQVFLSEVTLLLSELSDVVHQRLTDLMNETAALREMQSRRDAWIIYQRVRWSWKDGVLKQLQGQLQPTPVPAVTHDFKDTGLGLELLSTDVVETKILASRLVHSVMEKVTAPLNDLRLRMRLVEDTPELASSDILLPEVTLQALVEQWNVCGMPKDSWGLVNDALRLLLADRFKAIYLQCNAHLVGHGVLPKIDNNDRFKRPIPAIDREQPVDSGAPPLESASSALGTRASWGPVGQQGAISVTPAQAHPAAAGQALLPQVGVDRHPVNGTSLAQTQRQALNVVEQLMRLLSGQNAATTLTPGATTAPTPALACAIHSQAQAHELSDRTVAALIEQGAFGVTRMANLLRVQTGELKKKAETKGEKATIEIVALMFQAILTEERIPTSIRVWFARLQMPVLRVALSDADFLGTLTHPARLLIDRMGSCAMGFDQNAISGSALEAEIKRVVQVIEQYPESGARVFEIVYDEFQKFLTKFLTDAGNTPKVVGVAQQVEQKEILSIQYTIEMRNMLKDMAVAEDVRSFLFKVWAEVMAVSAMRRGAQHEDTLILKKTAADLVWSASAKPNREDRARMIRDLPELMRRLTSGMALLGIAPPLQNIHMKRISDIMAEAFMAKTETIPQTQMDAMIERLANLDDFVSEDGLGDLPLDAQSIELLLGIDASTIDVVMDGGTKPTPAMVACAEQLDLGAWMMLDHNGKIRKVQFVWRSEHKHLNLFVAQNGHSYLIQAGRLASYLQAGLLVLQESEALTVRATREALTKLEANPERLFQTD